MPAIYCQDCSALLRVPESADGRTIQCPKCDLVFTIRLDASTGEERHERDERDERDERYERDEKSDRPRKDDSDEQYERDETSGRRGRDERRTREDFDDRPRRAESRDADWDRYARRPRRKKKKSSSSLPLIIGGAVFGVAVVVVLIIFLVSALGSSIDDSKWKLFEDPNHLKVEMPGKPKRQALGEAMTGHMLEYNFSTAFIAAYTDPIAGLQLLAPDNLLNEMLNGIVREIAKEATAVEKRREPAPGNFPGRQIVVDLPKDHLTLSARCYLVGNRAYVICAVGRGFTPENPSVNRFFDSFEITDPAARPAPKVDPPPPPDPKVQRPPILNKDPVAPPPNSVDPAQAAISVEKSDATVLVQKDADEKLAKPGDTVYLNDMTEFGWLPGSTLYGLGKDGFVGKKLVGKKLDAKAVVKGQSLEKSLCQRTPMPPKYSRVAYSLAERASKFSGAVAISEDLGAPPKSTRFFILGDGVVLWRSGFIREYGSVESFRLDVSNVNILELRVLAETNKNGASGVWINPQVKVKE
jgi:DNA-directed RNA polymerase subunit M/transcription elongation factor TFIIS